MPYPAKTNAQAILAAAIDQVEQYGEEALSMRVLAKTLGLTPHALYRHYPDRAALEAGIAEEGFRRLQSALASAVSNHKGKDALREGAAAYLAFAQAHPALYSLLLSVHEQTPGLLQAEQDLWLFVVELLENTVGHAIAANAAVALWAFLHGFVELEHADVFGEKKPRSSFEVGLEAFLSGLTLLSSTTSP